MIRFCRVCGRGFVDLVRKKGEERMACATCRRGGKPLSRLVNGRPREKEHKQ